MWNRFINFWFNLNKQYKVIVFFSVIGLIILGFIAMSIWPNTSKLSQAKKEVDELTAVLNENIAIANNLDRFKQDVASLGVELEKAKELLPVDSNIHELVHDLNNAAVTSDLEFTLIKMSDDVLNNYYVEIPLDIALIGSYHHVTLFFDKVAKMDRIINIRDITMERPEFKNGEVVLDIKAKVTTFRQITDDERRRYQEGSKGKKEPERSASDGNVISDIANKGFGGK